MSLNLQLEPNSDPSDVELKLFDVLKAYLSEDSALSPQSAAQQIDALSPFNDTSDPASDEKQGPGGFLTEFWDLYFRVGYQIDYRSASSERLISLVKALRDLPNQSELESDYGDDKVRIWADLPILGRELADRWQRSDYNDPTPENQAFKRWMNINGIIARLTNEGLYSGNNEVLGCMYMGLEEEPKPGQKRAAERATFFNCYMPVAAMWITMCGPKIQEWCVAHAKATNTMAGRLWQGGQGFSTERWSFWKDRFLAASMNDAASSESREVALKAAERMDQIVA